MPVRVGSSRRADYHGASGDLTELGTHLRDFVALRADALVLADSPRALMVYQHATTVEDRAIADRLSGLVDAHRAMTDGNDYSDGRRG